MIRMSELAADEQQRENESGMDLCEAWHYEKECLNNYQHAKKEMKMAEKNPKLLTPTGFAKWAHIHTPKAAFQEKDGKTKGDPKYSVDVCFSADDADWVKWAGALKAQILALPQLVDKRTGENIPKQMPIKRELDIDDKPTGRYYIQFKTGEKFKPQVFDKFGGIIPDTVMVGNESKVRVSYTPKEYTAFGGGIALYLNAVQVLELVDFRANTADSFGFDVETLTVSDAAYAPETDDPFDPFNDRVPF